MLSRRDWVVAAVVLSLAIASILLVAQLLRRDAPEPREIPLAGAGRWGPLAVLAEVSNGSPQARTEGVVELTELCAYLVTPNGDVTFLVWPAQRTGWDRDRGEVLLENQDGELRRIGTGTRIAFGGGGASSAEGGLFGPPWDAGPRWAAAPDSSCDTDPRWYVTSASDVVD